MEALVSTAERVGRLDRADLGSDVVGGAGGLAGERLHLLGDDGEAAAGIAGAGGLDGGVEGKQVGLAGDVADQAEDRFDRLGVIRQRFAHHHRVAGLAGGAGGDLGRRFDLLSGILDGPDQSGSGLCRFAHRHRRLLGRSSDLAGLAQHATREGRGVAGGDAQGGAVDRGALHRCAKRRPEVGGEPVPLDPTGVGDKGVVNGNGEIALQRREAHQQVDRLRRRHFSINGDQQRLHRTAVAGGDHRQQGGDGDVSLPGGGDAAFDRLTPRRERPCGENGRAGR